MYRCQGGFYDPETVEARGPDFDRAGDAAGFRIAGSAERGGAGAAGSGEDVREAGAVGARASGYLRTGCVSGGGGAGAKSAVAGGEVSMVVVESEEEETK